MFESNKFVHMSYLLELPPVLAKTIHYLVILVNSLISNSNWQMICKSFLVCVLLAEKLFSKY